MHVARTCPEGSRRGRCPRLAKGKTYFAKISYRREAFVSLAV